MGLWLKPHQERRLLGQHPMEPIFRNCNFALVPLCDSGRVGCRCRFSPSMDHHDCVSLGLSSSMLLDPADRSAKRAFCHCVYRSFRLSFFEPLDPYGGPLADHRCDRIGCCTAANRIDSMVRGGLGIDPGARASCPRDPSVVSAQGIRRLKHRKLQNADRRFDFAGLAVGGMGPAADRRDGDGPSSDGSKPRYLLC